MAEELLERAHAEKASTLYRERVQQRPLLLRPSSPDATGNARAKRQHDRVQKEKAAKKCNKPKPLSAKQKRALCIHDIPQSQRKYAIYEPLHTMWCAYMREVLRLKDERGCVDAAGAGPFLTSADYHGALVAVVRSRCGSRVGLQGIVVKDTKHTFDLITKRNELKTVPKEHTVFRFEVPFQDEEGVGGKKPLVFELHGSRFETRAPERATKKYKMHVDMDSL